MNLKTPLLSTGITGWKLATKAFSESDKQVLRKQQFKIFWHAFKSPGFASQWFTTLETPEYASITTYRERLYIKPFRVYQSTKWDKKQKQKVIHDTFRLIKSKGPKFKQVINMDSPITIADFKLKDDINARITLGYDDKYRKEGELVLFFTCNAFGGLISATAFSFEELPNKNWVLRVGCIQGHKTACEKKAQKSMYGLRPKALMVYIVQEFARQLNMKAVYGAGNNIQANNKKHAINIPWLHKISFDYDAIWLESGGTIEPDGWFSLPLIPIRKSLEEIKSNKRSSYRKRYNLLDNISSETAQSVHDNCMLTNQEQQHIATIYN